MGINRKAFDERGFVSDSAEEESVVDRFSVGCHLEEESLRAEVFDGMVIGNIGVSVFCKGYGRENLFFQFLAVKIKKSVSNVRFERNSGCVADIQFCDDFFSGLFVTTVDFAGDCDGGGVFKFDFAAALPDAEIVEPGSFVDPEGRVELVVPLLA